ncbi:RiPP maturation radical SAM C-methyltransferase [Actinoplanes sp. NPDC051633]|uniref:RiPP maturation radical SAM C-methyltransferase n=1 Tax=Actinoplanes sp. NPDC051633 TaxID=3155670 RepID=UPI003439A612
MRVVLVSMPFVDVHGPSIQLGLLSAIASGRGHAVQTLHAGLDLAVALGADLYDALAVQRGRLVGDWLFAVEAFGKEAPDHDARLLDDFAGDLAHLAPRPADVRRILINARDVIVPAYLDQLAGSPIWRDVQVAGFTCTFQQSVASFALARRLKRRRPEIVTVFGGANFDGEMGLELVRCGEEIDYAVIGEGDDAFPGLLAALAAGTDPAAVPGVARRSGSGVKLTPPAPPRAGLDDLPTPDYTEYFDRAEALGVLEKTAHRTTALPFESARGCWWGEKHHCTFCGLNGTTMRFRSKSPERVLEELATLARRHRSFTFDAVDNILDARYLTTLLPAIVESRADYRLFYEVKANLTRAHLKLMAEAGVRHIQPGLESLDSGVLALMRKGVRAAQNVNVLRWATYYGIAVSWNILWGFPGETDQQYAAQAAAIPHLIHLPPPEGADRVWMERFSPLFAQNPDREPEASYRYVYPPTMDLGRIAYFFEYEPADALPATAYQGVRDGVAAWTKAWTKAWAETTRPSLTFWSAPDLVQIHDGRYAGREGTYTFEGTLARIYQAVSDRAMSAAAVRRRLGLEEPVEEIDEIFREFASCGLMFLDGDLALALALPATPGK